MADNNTLPLAVAGVALAGMFIEGHNQKKGNYAGVVPKNAVNYTKQGIAITLLVVVLTFTIDQAPDFGNPLALLILVALLIRYSKDFSIYFNETQKG